MAPERAEVDTRRAFSSVKEAVAVFDDRLHTATVKPVAKPPPPLQTSSASPSPPPSFASSASHLVSHDDEFAVGAALRKLEADMRETRRELLELKEREAETEAAVAALDADVRRSAPKLAAEEIDNEITDEASRVRSERWHEAKAEDDFGDGGGKFVEYLPTLAQAFSLVELEDDFGCRRGKQMAKTRRKKKKKKPIIPLIWDLFPKKKRPSFYLDDSSLYSRSFYSDLL